MNCRKVITNQELVKMSNRQIEKMFKNRQIRFMYDGNENEDFITGIGVSAFSEYPFTGGKIVDLRNDQHRYDIFKMDMISIVK